jgi:hypothetical protein
LVSDANNRIPQALVQNRRHEEKLLIANPDVESGFSKHEAQPTITHISEYSLEGHMGSVSF